MFHSLVLKISEEMLKEFVAGLILCHHVVLVGAGQMENDRNLQLNWIAVCSCHECFRSFLLATSPSFWAQVGYCEAAQKQVLSQIHWDCNRKCVVLFQLP